jgi:hypothetical protein
VPKLIRSRPWRHRSPDCRVLVEIVAEKLADAGQELVQSFSGGLRQGEAAIGQTSGGPQPLSAPLAQRPQSEQSIQPNPEEPDAMADLLTKYRH